MNDASKVRMQWWMGLGLSTSLALPVSAQSLLEEVVVTATKREESLQDVSIAVTALPDTILDQAKIVNSEDIVALVPSLNLQKGMNPRSSSFNIRGIGTQSFSTAAEPSVSAVLDGVVMGRSGQAFNQLLDIQRVEVLRGPQGTLFGKNASGGVVHVITKGPSEDAEGEVRASFIERGEYQLGATASGPVTDTMGVRVTAFGSHVDGWIDNVFNGEARNESDDWSVRGKARWQINDEMVLDWSSDYFRKDCICDQTAVRSVEPGAPQLDLLAPVRPGPENTQVNSDGDMYIDLEGQGHSGTFNWDIGDYTLTSITAYRTWDEDFEEDVDNLPVPVLVDFDQAGTLEQSQFTQEIRVASPRDEMLSYVAGAYFFKQSVRRTFARGFFGQTTHADFTVYTRNFAAFGQATLNLSEEFRMIGGLRYTKDELDYNFESFAGPTDAPIDDTFTRVAFGAGADESDVSGKLGIEYDVGEATLSYLSYSQGYKGPALNLTATSQQAQGQVGPETSDAFELGMKTSFFDGNLIFNVALFRTEYEDFQAEAYVPNDSDGNGVIDGNDDGTGVFELQNAGSVVTQGIEADFLARFGAIDLFGAVSFIDAEIKTFPGGPCSFGQQFRPGECPDGVQDLAGGKMPHTPDWKISLLASYTHELDAAPFNMKYAVNMRAQDDVNYTISQDPFAVQDGFGIVDLNIALLDKEDKYELIAYVKNVFDKFYVNGVGATVSVFIPNGYLHSVPKTAERTAGLELRYRW